MPTEVSQNENATENRTPADAVAITKAVADSLRMLNEVNMQQQQAIVALAVELAAATIRLVKNANSIAQANTGSKADQKTIEASAKDISEKLLGNLTTAPTDAGKSAVVHKSIPESKKSAAGDKNGIGDVLSIAYHNAVTSQQQLNTVAQASLTQGITLLYTLVTTSLSKVEEVKLKRIAETLNPGVPTE